jgi:hypothetical protein
MRISGLVWGTILAFSAPALAQTKAPAEKQKAAADKDPAVAGKQKEPAAPEKQKAAAAKDPAVAGKQKAAAATPAIPTLDAEALKKEAALLSKLSAEQRTKVAAAAKSLPGRVNAAAQATPAKTLDQLGKEAAITAGLGGADIESLVFLVLMQAAKSAQEDLKAIMASVKAVNAARMCKDNACLAAMKPAADYDQKTLDAVRSSVKGKVEGLSELGEMESLRLQTATAQLSKFATVTLSIAQKTSDSNQGVIQKTK